MALLRNSRRPAAQHDYESDSVASLTTVPAGVAGTPLNRVESDVGSIWVPAGDQVMLPFIERYKTWEPEEGALLTRVGHRDMVFVDIGASFGYFSRMIAHRFPSAKVHAFEPLPLMVSLLRLNTYEFGDRVTVWPTALGAARGTVGMSVATENVGDARANTETGVYEIVAPLSRFDDLVAGRVDVVKIDTQGFESDVITGMARTCAENPQIKLLLEFWPEAISQRHLRPSDVLGRYRSMGFEICLLGNRGALPASDDEIIVHAASAGRKGQATIVLRRSS